LQGNSVKESRKAEDNAALRLRWRFAVGIILLFGSYLAWPIIPFVITADIDPSTKSVLAAVLGATPFTSKFIAIALMGRPAYEFFKRTVWQTLRAKMSRASPALAPCLASSDPRTHGSEPHRPLPEHEARRDA
jgi:hypothetical protein